jgi:hypothetical protein
MIKTTEQVRGGESQRVIFLILLLYQKKKEVLSLQIRLSLNPVFICSQISSSELVLRLFEKRRDPSTFTVGPWFNFFCFIKTLIYLFFPQKYPNSIKDNLGSVFIAYHSYPNSDIFSSNIVLCKALYS